MARKLSTNLSRRSRGDHEDGPARRRLAGPLPRPWVGERHGRLCGLAYRRPIRPTNSRPKASATRTSVRTIIQPPAARSRLCARRPCSSKGRMRDFLGRRRRQRRREISPEGFHEPFCWKKITPRPPRRDQRDGRPPTASMGYPDNAVHRRRTIGRPCSTPPHQNLRTVLIWIRHSEASLKLKPPSWQKCPIQLKTVRGLPSERLNGAENSMITAT